MKQGAFTSQGIKGLHRKVVEIHRLQTDNKTGLASLIQKAPYWVMITWSYLNYFEHKDPIIHQKLKERSTWIFF